MTTHPLWTDEYWLPLMKLYLRRLCERYAGNPKRLGRDVRTLRQMRGFSTDGVFYDGVEVNETFERDFRPIAGHTDIMPVTLIVVLDLYFRLTPVTMVAETPEVVETARLTHLKAATIVGILAAFQACDPYLKRKRPDDEALYSACRGVWQRYGNGSPQELASLAAQLKEYF